MFDTVAIILLMILVPTLAFVEHNWLIKGVYNNV